MLLTITTPDHLLYGSDYPYVAPLVLTASLERMRQYLTDEPDLAPFREMILHKNAGWLLGQSETKAEAAVHSGKMLVRLAEIEVYPEHLKEYLAYANEVDRLSVEREPGVICLYPMQSAEDSTQIRILEIYASDEAYQRHLRTDHFLRYKQGTLHMVKALRLPTMQPLDPETMRLIFRKHP
jgi:quinol monooxygenase YgiN